MSGFYEELFLLMVGLLLLGALLSFVLQNKPKLSILVGFLLPTWLACAD